MSRCPCECAALCGDDPDLKTGRAIPCEARAIAMRCPSIVRMERGSDEATVVIHLTHRPSDDEFRHLANLVEPFGPPR